MIGMLQLTDAKHTRGANLSGGMKRKLSVGIALAGTVDQKLVSKLVSKSKTHFLFIGLDPGNS